MFVIVLIGVKIDEKKGFFSKMKTNLFVEKIIKLRILVGFLGEKKQFNWWDTQFLGKVSLKHLDIIFPRTAFSAALNSVTEAAKQIHDERIGKGNLIHLFRLPTFYEQQISIKLKQLNYDELIVLIDNKDESLNQLIETIDKKISFFDGPVNIGSSLFFISPDGLIKLTSYYFQAFTNNSKCFPYGMD